MLQTQGYKVGMELMDAFTLLLEKRTSKKKCVIWVSKVKAKQVRRTCLDHIT